MEREFYLIENDTQNFIGICTNETQDVVFFWVLFLLDRDGRITHKTGQEIHINKNRILKSEMLEVKKISRNGQKISGEVWCEKVYFPILDNAPSSLISKLTRGRA